MSPVARFRTSLDHVLDRGLAVIGAVACSQAPEFFQQYRQRLGGHLDEAKRQLAVFERTAAEAGLTLDRFIHQTSVNYDPAVAKLAGVMADAIARVQHLTEALAALQDASAWVRPFAFIRHLDPAIARAAWDNFRPAVPTTLEGLVYATAGGLLLVILYHLGPRRLVVRRGPAPAQTAVITATPDSTPKSDDPKA